MELDTSKNPKISPALHNVRWLKNGAQEIAVRKMRRMHTGGSKNDEVVSDGSLRGNANLR
jgi:hypothetical protein